MTFKGVEVVGPQAAVRFEPLVERLQRTGLDAVDAVLGGSTARDETGITQDPQVLGHRGLADPEGVDQLPDAALRRSEPVEDLPPGRFGDDGEGVRSHSSNMPLPAYVCQGM